MIVLSSVLFAATFAESAMLVSFQPNHFTFSGLKGQIVNRTIVLTNQGNQTAIIKMKYNATGLLVIPQTITLNVSSSQNVLILYTLPTNISLGNISLSLSELNLSVTVNYTVNLQPIIQAPVEVFPNPPISGSDIAVFFTGTSKGLIARGFLYVNGFIYSVDINGFGIISLDKNAYGPATLYLFGNSILSNQSMKTFTIQQGSALLVTINMPQESMIDADVPVIVKYGQDPLGNAEVKITDPDGNQETYTTDNQGKIEFTATAIGKWKATVTSGNQMASASTEIKYGTLPLGLAEDTPPQLGSTTTIVTIANTKVDVYIDDMFESSHTAPSDGLIPLPITKGGTYILKGELENKRSQFTFNIPGRAEIIIMDASTQMQVTNLQRNTRYDIRVTDASGNPLSEAESLWISNPSGTQEMLSLSEGMGTWYPMTDGLYTLSVDDTSTVGGNSRTITIKPISQDFGLLTGVIVFIVMIVMLFIILVLIAAKRHVPVNQVIMSIFKKKRRVELPV